jgi:hypothetical protein
MFRGDRSTEKGKEGQRLVFSWLEVLLISLK